MKITLRQLEIFLAVAKHGNISRAAKSLHLSQPAVTMQIKQLETLLKKPLIEIHGRQTLLTPNGRRVLSHAKAISQSMDELENEILDESKMKGKLRFAVTPVVAAEFLELLGKFKEMYPLIEIESQVIPMVDTPDILINNDVDLCISPVLEQNSRSNAIELFQMKMYLVASKNHHLAQKKDLSIADIADETFICPEGNSVSEGLLQSISKETFRKPDTLNIRDRYNRRAALRAGLGIGIIPETIIESPQAKACNDLLPLDMEGFPLVAKYSLVQMKSKRLPLVAKTFKEFLIKHYLPDAELAEEEEVEETFE